VKRATLLRNLLLSDQVEFLMGAHDGLSARIAAEAGFAGLWASGLSIAASLGVRDSNEASWTQILEVCEFMNDAVSVPILMDGDTGFGNFNKDRRHPIILIPTKYYTADPERLAALGANMIIWANHSLRASISAMQEVVRKIHTDSTIAGVEAQIAPTEEVFRLQDTDELKEATRRYLPTSRNKVVD